MSFDGTRVGRFRRGDLYRRTSAVGRRTKLLDANGLLGSLKASMCHQLAESFEADVSSLDASALNAGVY
jgi:hypothetical protein